jgi:REP element-mobilizing transposase RayT
MLRASEPVHVNVRVVPSVGWLRKHDMFLALRDATIVVTKHEDFRIVHMSIQGTHVHFIVEARDRMALARGMQAFQISAAKQINGVIRERTGEKRRGSVFTDRYHARIMRTPREVRNCIGYVLNNWRHHGEHRKRLARGWDIDPYSSAISFSGWKELEHADVMPKPPVTYRPLVVWLPKSHLLSTLWRKHGLISCDEVPGGS